MRFVRQLAKVLLTFLILFDISVLHQVWRQGTRIIAIENDPLGMGMIDGPITYQSILIAIAIQIVLVGLLLWSRRKFIHR
jgi:hypothetical protein